MPVALRQVKAISFLNLLAFGNFTIGLGAFVVTGIITPTTAALTGSVALAGSIASAEVLTKVVLYYFHERGRAHIKWSHQ